MVEIYDTTLRDGTQSEGLILSVDDKLLLAQRLIKLGIHYVEGGWPGSNPRDREFFARAADLEWGDTRLVAFGSTNHPDKTPENDPNLEALLRSGAKAAALVGKAWGAHVKEQLKVSLQRNLELVSGSVAHLTGQGLEVFLDAEHFFDGFNADPEYGIEVCRTAADAGARALVLCDTDGGNLPGMIAEVTRRVVESFPGVTVGIHAHNDSDLAVAASLAAVDAGARQVQGTIGGYGERCGNANLCSIIPNLQLKMGFRCLEDGKLARLTEIANYLQEIANLPPNRYAPYVGTCAFTHKGGLHISAVEKNPSLYEHIDPAIVGNTRRTVLSDLAGRAAVLRRAREWGMDLDESDPLVREMLVELKERENQGYLYGAAEASFELLVYRAMGHNVQYFDLVGFRVMDFKASEDAATQAEATVRVRMGNKEEHTAAMGDGPVHALDLALRKALLKFYPQLEDVKLVDYKVRVLTPKDGPAAMVRTLILSSDGESTWGTVGVGVDVLEASWQALGDSIRYKLFKFFNS